MRFRFDDQRRVSEVLVYVRLSRIRIFLWHDPSTCLQFSVYRQSRTMKVRRKEARDTLVVFYLNKSGGFLVLCSGLQFGNYVCRITRIEGISVTVIACWRLPQSIWCCYIHSNFKVTTIFINEFNVWKMMAENDNKFSLRKKPAMCQSLPWIVRVFGNFIFSQSVIIQRNHVWLSSLTRVSPWLTN